MFGAKKEKTVQQPPPLPEGVVFHVMPGKYQGVKGTYTPPPRQTPAPSNVSGKPLPSTPSLPTPPTHRGAEQAAKAMIARPAALVGGKKMLIIWGIVAFVILGGGGLAALLLLPGKPKPAPAEQPLATPEPTLSTPEGVGTPIPAAPGIEAVPPPPAPEPILAPAIPTDIVSSTDTDFDGLTDVEEALYTTDPAKADRDSDGYLDGQEVENLYNPTGNAPIRIVDSNLVARYTNPAFGYSIFYPTSWVVRALDDKNPREVLFTAPTGEFIQVIVDDNSEGLAALQWYAKQFPDVLPESLERIFVDNLEGVWTKDKATVYLTKTAPLANGKRLLFGITYNYGERTSVNFRTTFKMMMKSFTTL